MLRSSTRSVATRYELSPGATTKSGRWAAATRPIHWELLSRPDLFYLARLPVTRTLTLDGRTFHLVHATPRDPLDEYLTDEPDAWRSRLESVEADYICVGHSHLPFHLDLGRTQVVNPGSVGQPRDGDPRASYAVIENGTIEFHRVAYDLDAVIRQMRRVGLSEEWVAQAEFALRTGGKFPEPAASTKRL